MNEPLEEQTSNESNTYSSSERSWMQMALDLAERGKGEVEPNPMVGAVLVKNNEVVGKGYHQEYGGDHAEREALRDAGERSENSELFINLEPCCVSNKTPPCTKKLIDAGIRRVVAAMPDPNPRVRGNGFETLREQGINVEVGLCQKEAAYLNRQFITFHLRDRPHIIAKWAMSFDGKIATHTGDSQWITSDRARTRARALRVEAGAVMVGIGTVIEDNPTLLGPNPDRENQPVRIIVDSRLRLPPGYDIVETTKKAPIIVATREGANPRKKETLENQGIEILEIPSSGRQVPFDRLCTALAKKGLLAVHIEGGGTLLGSAFEQDLVDEVKVFVAPKIIGGSDAKTPVEGTGIEKIKEAPQLSNVRAEWMNPDLLLEGLYQEPPLFELEEMGDE